MNYVILEKAMPYTRVKRGKLERVRGYTGKRRVGKPKVEDRRIRKIDEALAKEEQKQLKTIFSEIKSSLEKRLKKISPTTKIKWSFNKGDFSDWEERYTEWPFSEESTPDVATLASMEKFWVPTKHRVSPWIQWEFSTPGEEKYQSPKDGFGSISFYPASVEPDTEGHNKMSFKVGDSGFGDKLKNRGLYSSIFSVLAKARDKGWLEDRLYVHVGSGTKAWNKLAKKFKFPYIGNE